MAIVFYGDHLNIHVNFEIGQHLELSMLIFRVADAAASGR